MKFADLKTSEELHGLELVIKRQKEEICQKKD